MGGMLPFVIWRLDARFKFSTGQLKIKQLASQYSKDNFLMTTSGQFSPDALQCTIATLGADSILFAVDYPFESTEAAMQFIETVPVSAADKENICHMNAERVLRL
jgi:2,3-dihydroxybenzoate decarboxylase